MGRTNLTSRLAISVEGSRNIWFGEEVVVLPTISKEGKPLSQSSTDDINVLIRGTGIP